MTTHPKVDHDALAALALLASTAATHVAAGDAHELLVPMNKCPVLPGEAELAGTRTIEAIAVLRYLVQERDEPTPPDIEILHVRDPDNACYVTTWVDGALTTLAHVEDIDVGRGWTKEDWDARIREVQHESPGYSQGFRNAVLGAMADPPGSDHIR